MKHASYKLVVMTLTLVLGGCGTAPSNLDLSIISHYQTKSRPQALALDVQVTNPQMDLFVHEVLRYAVSKNIALVSAELAPPSATRIVISSSDESISTNSGRELVRSYLPESGSLRGKAKSAPAYKAELQSLDESRHTVFFSSLNPSIAQLLVDELLLLWHPPLVNQGGQSNIRIPVPEYALKPTSYNVSQKIYFGVSPSRTNMGHQAWYELASNRPTFYWEEFPRILDYSQDIDADDITNVRYDFRLYRAVRRGIGFVPAGAQNHIIARDGLTSSWFTVEEELPPCTPYMWTVRASFELDGTPRHTEWAGAFNIGSAGSVRPWYWRRDVSRPLAMEPYPGTMFFTVLTPKSPFADDCEF